MQSPTCALSPSSQLRARHSERSGPAVGRCRQGPRSVKFWRSAAPAGERERDSRGNGSWHSLHFQLFEAKFDFCSTTATKQVQPNGAAMPALSNFPSEEFRQGQHLLPVSDGRARVGDSQSSRSCGRGVGAQRQPCPCSPAVGALPLAHMARDAWTQAAEAVWTPNTHTCVAFLGRRVQM